MAEKGVTAAEPVTLRQTEAILEPVLKLLIDPAGGVSAAPTLERLHVKVDFENRMLTLPDGTMAHIGLVPIKPEELATWKRTQWLLRVADAHIQTFMERQQYQEKWKLCPQAVPPGMWDQLHKVQTVNAPFIRDLCTMASTRLPRAKNDEERDALLKEFSDMLAHPPGL